MGSGGTPGGPGMGSGGTPGGPGFVGTPGGPTGIGSGVSSGTPGGPGPTSDPNITLNESFAQRNNGSTFHIPNVEHEEVKLYMANNLANKILRNFGNEFNMDMKPFMQSQYDILAEISIDHGNALD